MKPQSPLLIGINGLAGVGKDTFAEQFHFHGFRQYAFATPVKKVCEVAFGFSPTYFTDRHLKEEIHPFWHKSPREVAQLVGTELFRSHFGADFWIRRLELQLINDFDHCSEVRAVISDVRFTNEAQWILASGGVLIHLTRPGYSGKVGIPDHASEAGIKFQELNGLLKGDNYYNLENNSTVQALQALANSTIQRCLVRRAELATVIQ